MRPAPRFTLAKAPSPAPPPDDTDGSLTTKNIQYYASQAIALRAASEPEPDVTPAVERTVALSETPFDSVGFAQAEAGTTTLVRGEAMTAFTKKLNELALSRSIAENASRVSAGGIYKLPPLPDTPAFETAPAEPSPDAADPGVSPTHETLSETSPTAPEAPRDALQSPPSSAAPKLWALALLTVAVVITAYVLFSRR